MSEKKQYISRIKLADGTTAEVKDQEARIILDSLFTDTIIFDCGGAPIGTTSVDVLTDNDGLTLQENECKTLVAEGASAL